MSLERPYFRTCRQFSDGSYAHGGKSKYIELQGFAQDASHYVRAFLLIQKDVINLFDYIEPADQNVRTYSFRVHELLLRTCIEVEANLKAILRENGYSCHTKKKRSIKEQRPEDEYWNMNDYLKIEQSHFLSSYQIIIPNWHGQHNTITPFESFRTLENSSPDWYRAYNETKHDRHEKFIQANFQNLMAAIAGLLALLSSQFYTYDFSSGNTLLALENDPNDDTESGIGGYFRVRFPNTPAEACYNFEYKDIQDPRFTFMKYQYKDDRH